MCSQNGPCSLTCKAASCGNQWASLLSMRLEGLSGQPSPAAIGSRSLPVGPASHLCTLRPHGSPGAPLGLQPPCPSICLSHLIYVGSTRCQQCIMGPRPEPSNTLDSLSPGSDGKGCELTKFRHDGFPNLHLHLSLCSCSHGWRTFTADRVARVFAITFLGLSSDDFS